MDSLIIFKIHLFFQKDLNSENFPYQQSFPQFFTET